MEEIMLFLGTGMIVNVVFYFLEFGFSLSVFEVSFFLEGCIWRMVAPLPSGCGSSGIRRLVGSLKICTSGSWFFKDNSFFLFFFYLKTVFPFELKYFLCFSKQKMQIMFVYSLFSINSFSKLNCFLKIIVFYLKMCIF